MSIPSGRPTGERKPGPSRILAGDGHSVSPSAYAVRERSEIGIWVSASLRVRYVRLLATALA